MQSNGPERDQGSYSLEYLTYTRGLRFESISLMPSSCIALIAHHAPTSESNQRDWMDMPFHLLFYDWIKKCNHSPSYV